MKAAAETVTMPTRNRFITIVSHAKRMREFAIERSPLDTNRGLLEGDHTIAPPETEARPNTFLSPENRNFRGTQTTMRSFNQYDTAREEGTPDSAQRDHQRVGSQVVIRGREQFRDEMDSVSEYKEEHERSSEKGINSKIII